MNSSKFKYQVNIVGGAGHVGLPLAITFALSGMNTVIYDINKATLEKISKGIMPFLEDGAEEKLKAVLKSKKLHISADPKSVADSENIILTMGTPIDEFMNPKMQDVFNGLNAIMPHLKSGQLIVLRSTVFPGTTNILNERLKKAKKKVGLAFCPERIAEGKAIQEIHQLPQIVSGVDAASAQKAKALFTPIAKSVVTLSPLEAELAKLFTNSWRYIQFSIANQFYMIAQQSGLDFHKIFNAIKFDYPRAKDFPGPGFAAGPCLLKDTMQIAAFNNNNFALGHSAMLVNEGLPNFLVTQLKQKVNLKKKKVGILGMAFKGNSDDKRTSLAYKLKKLLETETAEVYCTDIYIKEEGFVSTEALLKKCDVIIVGAPHREYKKLAIRKGQILVDPWKFINS